MTNAIRYTVIEQRRFLSGFLVGLTIEGTFPIADPSDYDVAREIGSRVRSLHSPDSVYEVIGARIVRSL